MDFRNKNDYSVIVFFENEQKPLKFEYVHSCYALSKWLDSSFKYKNWKYFNVYVRRSSMYLRRFYKGSFIPAKPR